MVIGLISMLLLCSVPEPPQIIRHMEPKVASVGRAIRFSVQVSGIPKPQVSWYKDSQALVTSDTCKFFYDNEDYTLMLLNVSTEDAGSYSCEAKNEYGDATSSAPLTVEGMHAGAPACFSSSPGKPGQHGSTTAFGALNLSFISKRKFHLCCHGDCFPGPKMAEARARISAPILVAPMEDVLVFENHRAQFQCRISGEGSSCFS